MNKSYLKSLIQISSISFRWKDFCFDEDEIDYIEWLRAKAFEILSKNELLEEQKLSEIKKVVNENKLKIDTLTKKSIIWDSTVKTHSKSQYKIIAKYWSLDHEWKDENINILKFLAIIHNIWELAVWDTTLEQKTKNWENNEKIEAKEIIEKLYSWESGNFLEIYDIDSNENHPLHKEFKLYEILSYINWAILTYKNRENIENSSEILKKVFEKHIPRLICEISRWRKSFTKFTIDNLWYICEICSVINYDMTNIFIAITDNSRLEIMEEESKEIIKQLKEKKFELIEIFNNKIDWKPVLYEVFLQFLNKCWDIPDKQILSFGLCDIFTVSILINWNILTKNQWIWILLANMHSWWNGRRYIHSTVRKFLLINNLEKLNILDNLEWKIDKELIIQELRSTYKKWSNISCPFYKSESKNDFLESAINYFLEDIIPNIKE